MVEVSQVVGGSLVVALAVVEDTITAPEAVVMASLSQHVDGLK